MKPEKRRDVPDFLSLEEEWDTESSPKYGTQWNSERTADKQSLSGFLSDFITDTGTQEH